MYHKTVKAVYDILSLNFFYAKNVLKKVQLLEHWNCKICTVLATHDTIKKVVQCLHHNTIWWWCKDSPQFMTKMTKWPLRLIKCILLLIENIMWFYRNNTCSHIVHLLKYSFCYYSDASFAPNIYNFMFRTQMSYLEIRLFNIGWGYYTIRKQLRFLQIRCFHPMRLNFMLRIQMSYLKIHYNDIMS